MSGGTILDIHNPWRDALLHAMFDGVPFYVESGARESGRRTVVHEFPKRDTPYSEDMGQRAVEYTVRGYVICFVSDAGPLDIASLKMRDYRIARDRLQMRLDAGGEGILQLPYMARALAGPVLTKTMVCTRYRMTEEDRFGGYAVFDMTFADCGSPPIPAIAGTQINLKNLNAGLAQTTTNLNEGP
jgi:hypothetical protein